MMIMIEYTRPDYAMSDLGPRRFWVAKKSWHLAEEARRRGGLQKLRRLVLNP